MRKIFVAIAAGLFVLTLAACGGSTNKAKTSSSETDSSATDSSDSKSSDSKSSSSKSNGGGSVDAFCAEIQSTASAFSDISGTPSDKEIDTVVEKLHSLQDTAPDEIKDAMDTFIGVEVAAASAAKAAANNSDAQSSAVDKVTTKAGDAFVKAATDVSNFAVKSCGFDLNGQSGSFSS